MSKLKYAYGRYFAHFGESNHFKHNRKYGNLYKLPNTDKNSKTTCILEQLMRKKCRVWYGKYLREPDGNFPFTFLL